MEICWCTKSLVECGAAGLLLTNCFAKAVHIRAKLRTAYSLSVRPCFVRHLTSIALTYMHLRTSHVLPPGVPVVVHSLCETSCPLRTVHWMHTFLEPFKEAPTAHQYCQTKLSKRKHSTGMSNSPLESQTNLKLSAKIWKCHIRCIKYSYIFH